MSITTQLQKSSLMMNIFKFYLLRNFQIYIIVNYSHHAIHYIPKTYLRYNWKCLLSTSTIIQAYCICCKVWNFTKTAHVMINSVK